jgi:hypothetical protein
MNWEQALRGALRRREPPPGFAERVLERTSRQAAVVVRRPSRPWLRWCAVAASLTLLVAGGYQYREHRLRGEEARDQLLEALRVTETKLELVRERINRKSGAARSETTQENRI